MMDIIFSGLPSDVVARIRSTGLDTYGQKVERHRSTGDAYPCRHCLGETPQGEAYLILAHRPFATSNPYAETGPIFLCAGDCAAAPQTDIVPPILRSPRYLVRGYDAGERIVYGTGDVVETARISDFARALFRDEKIAFVDVRSASNNCFQCRIHRAE